MINIKTICFSIAAALSISSHAAILTGQFNATGIVTPYSGTNGTGTVVSDLTLARSLVFKNAVVANTSTGSFTNLITNSIVTFTSPALINPPKSNTTLIWVSGKYSFTSESASTLFTSSGTTLYGVSGVFRDGTNGDETLGSGTLTVTLVPSDPANSSFNLQSSSSAIPVPRLSIKSMSGKAILSWPTNLLSATNYILQSSTANLPATAWSNVAGSPSIVGTNFVITNTIAGSFKYFRLITQ